MSLALSVPGAAKALDRSRSLIQYQHTSWAEREGAPAGIHGITQTGDGYLWLSTPQGLYRFDGVSFEKITVLGGVDLSLEPVTGAFATPDGALLLNFGSHHGIATYQRGKLLRFPDCSLGSAVVATDNDSWLLCNRRPVRFAEGKLQALDRSWGYPDGDTLALVGDTKGSIWAATATGAWRLRRGESAFHVSDIALSSAQVAAPDGSLWSFDSRGITVASASSMSTSPSRIVSSRPFMLGHVDRDGGLWAADERGLAHVGDPGNLDIESVNRAFAADTITRQTGLSADRISTIFEDIDGNVWVGTSLGLERFRNNALLPIRLPDRNLAFSIAAGKSGDLFAANYIGRLMRLGSQGIRDYRQIGPGISCISKDHDGSIWVAADKGKLWHLRDGEVVEMLQVPMEIHGSMVTSVTRSPSGELWIGSTVNGVIGNYANGHWTVAGGQEGLPARWSARSVLADSKGRVWSGVKRTEIILLDHGVPSRFTAADGLDAGEIFAIIERGSHIWVGGSKGVAYFDGKSFKALNAVSENAFQEVNGLVEASNGDLWVHELEAAKRVPASELARAFSDPDYRVKLQRFDTLDGLYGTTPPSAARATIAEGSDGLIWFSTTEGVMSIDPRRTLTEGRTPSVVLKSVTVDGGNLGVDMPLDLSPRTRSIRFVYSAINPGAPERIRYRYRLDGLDEDWYDAGKRRSVSYTTLAAGTYRFRVSSTNETGSWMDNEKGFDFRIEPLWYNSALARALYLLAAATISWLAYRGLVQRATARIRWAMSMRQDERDRIARDLHDTLLQGVHGLTWKIQTIANGISSEDPARQKLESALDTAEELVAESRRRVHMLRDDQMSPGTLLDALHDAVGNIAAAHPSLPTFHCTGEEFAITGPARKAICDVVREAFLNAVTHGRAASINIYLMYASEDLVVRIEDDGIGMEAEVARRGRDGHWGIMGMQERALELGGSLEIDAAIGQGANVTLRLPRSRIAQSRRRGFRWHPLLRIFRPR